MKYPGSRINVYYNRNVLGDSIEQTVYVWEKREPVYLNPADEPQYDYDLATMPSHLLSMDNWPECGDMIKLGGLRLRVVSDGYQIQWDSYIVMRDGWRAWLRAKWYVVVYFLDKAFYRLLLTALVWGLADPISHRNQIPMTWRDVYFLCWIEKALKYGRTDNRGKHIYSC